MAKKATRPPSPEAIRQRELRLRMTKEGMTIPRIYMTKDEQAWLKQELQRLRLNRTHQRIEHMDNTAMSNKWTTKTLFDALHEHADQTGHPFGLTLHNGDGHAIDLRLREFGDLPVIIVVAEHEIRVSSLLCALDSVKDTAKFNEACLRRGPMLPLSNIGLVDGHYIVFGQLSIHSPLANIIEELDVLGQNTIQTADEFSSLIH